MGVTEIEVIVALVTLMVAEAFAEPRVALMVDTPGVKPFANPLA